MPNCDWKPEEITKALAAKGLTIYEILQQYQLTKENFSYQQLEATIAEVLNIPLYELWPSRYMDIDTKHTKVM